ncbi:acyltransferase ChoActase/COT/CPT [Rozella allomycis CSF55]|uniref:Acyltransferase ChoActase/COT/CPT n=1 Tax=Rozella allomycis (strain CSF55) TaxID=988480 RepID=A0A4P9YKW4_ROZAC|nr:acyltransferase ChoActase/COT/CPT [Rozella allomycis CSF55]
MLLQFTKRYMSTFSMQQKIPRLPIPTLEETSKRYLLSLQPLLGPNDYTRAESAVNDFIKPNGFGQLLQNRLYEYDKVQKYSWLEDIWFNKAYLEYREPVLVNVNWFMLMKDSPIVPESLLVQKGEGQPLCDIQLYRAACIIRFALEYHLKIIKEEIPVDKIKDTVLCMNQYRNMFGVTRIPKENRDEILFPFPSSSKTVCILIEDQIYSLQVIGDNGIYSIGEILNELKALKDVHLKSTKYESVCVLTGEHRDVWTKAYNILSKSEINKESFNKINNSLLCMSLDHVSPGNDLDLSARMAFHRLDGRNRWFDKALSFCVFSNGRAALNGEHSPCDAVVPGYILDYIVSQESKLGNIEEIKTDQNYLFDHLKWDVNDEVKQMIENAKANVLKTINDQDTVVFYFKVGSLALKELRCSPDGFAQMGMQLAFYKMHQRCPATYESASTRQFLHGRTECVRVLSNESLKFVQSMQDFKESDSTKFDNFKEALKSHLRYMTDATLGRGVDRHLLGLRMMMQPDESHQMFKDPSFAASCNFELSTSNMSPGNAQLALGFGTVTDTGYGINYAIAKDYMKFTISSKYSCPETSSSQFRQLLENSLKEIHSLLVKNSQSTAKL